MSSAAPSWKQPIGFDPDRKPTTWCYIRVSTWSQDLLKERFILEKFAEEQKMPSVKFMEDQISGKVPWKDRKIGDLMSQVLKGDVVLVHEISRLSRRMGDIFEIMEDLANKDVPLFTVKDACRYGKDLNSKILATIMGMCADIERELISTRTADAIAARKAKNVATGKKTNIGNSKLTEFQDRIIQQLVDEIPKSKVCADLPCKCSVSNLNSYLNKRGLNEVIIRKIREKSEMRGRKIAA
jgi:DNA invertase Pin-like site-specific DNA recombinase